MLGEIQDILGPAELQRGPVRDSRDLPLHILKDTLGNLRKVDISDIARAQVWWNSVAQEDLPLLAAGGTPQNISIDHYSFHEAKAHAILSTVAEKFLRGGGP